MWWSEIVVDSHGGSFVAVRKVEIFVFRMNVVLFYLILHTFP